MREKFNLSKLLLHFRIPEGNTLCEDRFSFNPLHYFMYSEFSKRSVYMKLNDGSQHIMDVVCGSLRSDNSSYEISVNVPRQIETISSSIPSFHVVIGYKLDKRDVIVEKRNDYTLNLSEKWVETDFTDAIPLSLFLPEDRYLRDIRGKLHHQFAR